MKCPVAGVVRRLLRKRRADEGTRGVDVAGPKARFHPDEIRALRGSFGLDRARARLDGGWREKDVEIFLSRMCGMTARRRNPAKEFCQLCGVREDGGGGVCLVGKSLPFSPTPRQPPASGPLSLSPAEYESCPKFRSRI